MQANPLVKPFLKWAGGKRYLIPEIKKRWPANFKQTYFEPFLGGGAVLLSLQPARAIVNDINAELINCYLVVRDAVDELIDRLEQYGNNEALYYQVRDWDRASDFSERSPVERASRIIFLNKTCYNGLFRVNSQGQFNVPYGRYKDPNIVDRTVLRAVHHYLNEADITFLCGDFEDALAPAKKGDFVYLDPPYDSISDPASFTGYNLKGFGKTEQERLRLLADDLQKRHCKFLLSNAYTDHMEYLYRRYKIDRVAVPRSINSNAAKRGKVDEMLVRNYEPQANRKKKERPSMGATLLASLLLFQFRYARVPSCYTNSRRK